jgi:hypothetical protein
VQNSCQLASQLQRDLFPASLAYISWTVNPQLTTDNRTAQLICLENNSPSRIKEKTLFLYCCARVRFLRGVFSEPLLRNGCLFIRLLHSHGCSYCLFWDLCPPTGLYVTLFRKPHGRRQFGWPRSKGASSFKLCGRVYGQSFVKEGWNTRVNMEGNFIISRGVKLTTHLLVLMSRKCGSIHPLPHTPPWHGA